MRIDPYSFARCWGHYMHKVEHGPRIVRFRIVGGRARKPQRERERQREKAKWC